jgi:hypothetical protein
MDEPSYQPIDPPPEVQAPIPQVAEDVATIASGSLSWARLRELELILGNTPNDRRYAAVMAQINFTDDGTDVREVRTQDQYDQVIAQGNDGVPASKRILVRGHLATVIWGAVVVAAGSRVDTVTIPGQPGANGWVHVEAQAGVGTVTAGMVSLAAGGTIDTVTGGEVTADEAGDVVYHLGGTVNGHPPGEIGPAELRAKLPKALLLGVVMEEHLRYGREVAALLIEAGLGKASLGPNLDAVIRQMRTGDLSWQQLMPLLMTPEAKKEQLVEKLLAEAIEQVRTGDLSWDQLMKLREAKDQLPDELRAAVEAQIGVDRELGKKARLVQDVHQYDAVMRIGAEAVNPYNRVVIINGVALPTLTFVPGIRHFEVYGGTIAEVAGGEASAYDTATIKNITGGGEVHVYDTATIENVTGGGWAHAYDRATIKNVTSGGKASAHDTATIENVTGGGRAHAEGTATIKNVTGGEASADVTATIENVTGGRAEAHGWATIKNVASGGQAYAWGTATIETVTGGGWAHAYDRATIKNVTSGKVHAYGSSRVTARGSAHVTAEGNAVLRVYDSVTATCRSTTVAVGKEDDSQVHIKGHPVVTSVPTGELENVSWALLADPSLARRIGGGPSGGLH